MRLTPDQIAANLAPVASGIHTEPAEVATPVCLANLPIRVTATVYDAQLLTDALRDWHAPSQEAWERSNLLIKHLRFAMEDAVRDAPQA